MKSVQNTNVQKCFYIDGPGGSGKTYLYRALIEKFNLIHKKTLIVAWTGIAAILLPGGMMCHSAFSLPLDLSTVKFPRLSQSKREILKSLELLIWDEALMAPGTALEIVDLVFQDLMDNKLPFGVKVVILGGDFRQVLPVVRKGSRGIQLSKNMRAITDPDFSQWLLNVGNGVITKPSSAKTNFSIKVPNSLLSNNIVTDIFGASFTCTDVQNISQRAILCSKNEHVRLINENVLALLQNSEKITFNAIDSVKNNDGSENDNLQVNIPVEYLNSLNPPGFPPFKLNIKLGCTVMLLRNLSVKNGLCNGTRLIVLGTRQNVIQCKINNGSFAGSVHFIPRISLDTANDPALPFNFVRHQFPLNLAYALTINKSQGQTFEKVGIYLEDPCFSHGQLYTGCSRAMNSSSLKIQIKNNTLQGETIDGVVTDNIVYKEIF
ncbi:ATP-dependent DNA helicase pif1-like [Condylostylus longicornis]|uniref:ATP-dependent DNA helicase pif1-like n=1 Tax=Condylostylus longicornis TaxID=2530218 RepID=UPI00244E404B|nr:ATP-dependent DNA helicase pif1-like [Condylostylus longicornis]